MGSGTYGNVIKAVHSNTKEVRAIKVIQKNKVRNKERFQLEIDIMRQLVRFSQFSLNPLNFHNKFVTGPPKRHQIIRDLRRLPQFVPSDGVKTQQISRFFLKISFRLCEGGELFDRIIAKGHFNEKEARNIFTQIMLALNYCHANKICHRDLKPENFLLLTKADDSPIKVIDFGLSTYITEKGAMTGSKVSMSTKAGTVKIINFLL